eukprot:scaffold5237_cov170-Ochromonas_danica.AAC.16
MLYDVNPNVQYSFCLAQSDAYLKHHGNSVTGLIQARGYMPTCRVLHLLLWMRKTVQTERLHHATTATTTASSSSSTSSYHHLLLLEREPYVVDVGANIGACTTHLAALGYPVIAFEPVPEHLKIIEGSLKMNPLMQVQLYRGGVGVENKKIEGRFDHQSVNWGGTKIAELPSSSGGGAGGGGAAAGGGGGDSMEITMFKLDTVLHNHRVALLKIDCEGCEYAALKGTTSSSSSSSLLLLLPCIIDKAGNETASDREVLHFLESYGFDLYIDHWGEIGLYHGGQGNKVLEIDRIFGSRKFHLGLDQELLHTAARKILSDPVRSESFSMETFRKKGMDIIAIQRSLSDAMKNLVEWVWVGYGLVWGGGALQPLCTVVKVMGYYTCTVHKDGVTLSAVIVNDNNNAFFPSLA